MKFGNILIQIGIALGGTYVEVPGIDCALYKMKFSDMVNDLAALGIEWQCKAKYMEDYEVGYTDRAGWSLIIPYLILPADLYVAELADCDDYSRFASAKSAMYFKRNACRQCWGNTPLGKHAFGIVPIWEANGRTYELFESNAGFPFAGKLFKFGENDYIPKSWR